MSTDLGIYGDDFADLRYEYQLSLESRAAKITLSWQKCTANVRDAEAFNEFFRLTHSLAGLSGSLGFIAISQKAHDLQSLICDVQEGRQTLLARSTVAGLETAFHILLDEMEHNFVEHKAAS